MKDIKMYYEYCNYNTQDVLNTKDEMKKVFNLLDKGLNGFCTDIFQMREIAKFLPEGFDLYLSDAVSIPSLSFKNFIFTATLLHADTHSSLVDSENK